MNPAQLITADEAIRRARERVYRPALTPTQRLHTHLRNRLSGHPAHVIEASLDAADNVFLDGAGHMQTAIDAGVSVASHFGATQ